MEFLVSQRIQSKNQKSNLNVNYYEIKNKQQQQIIEIF